MLHYKRSGQGPPLVLVHGFLGGVPEWGALFTYFAPLFDVIAVDLPGFGGSAQLPAPASLADAADLTADQLHALGVERCHLLGHSLGSMIAQEFAIRHGPRVERLVLYGAACSGALPGRFETFDTTIERLRSVGIAEGADPIIASWFVAGRSHHACAMYRKLAEQAVTETAIATLRAIARWHAADRLNAITARTLVIGGDRDRSTDAAEQFKLWRGLPSAQLCILPNCAHAAHLEQPDLFNKVLGRFLTEP
ncbi:MAG: alpha/beta fold hydrolase [Burkholderiales bacterium]|nr:alpha/beta fold hydrolase [Burkholderiales bacterium]